MRRTIFTAALAGALFVPVDAAGQVSLGLTFNDVNPGHTMGAFSIGYQFNVLNPFMLTHLGFYDHLMNGLAEAHEVGIWDPDKNLIATAVVPAGTSSTLMGYFRMVSVAPLMLTVGNGYRIAALTGNEAYTSSPIGLSTHDDIKFVKPTYVSATALKYPRLSMPSYLSMQGYFGPTFATSPATLPAPEVVDEPLPDPPELQPEDVATSTVPEPMSMLLVGTGLLGIAGVRRLRRRDEDQDA